MFIKSNLNYLEVAVFWFVKILLLHFEIVFCKIIILDFKRIF